MSNIRTLRKEKQQTQIYVQMNTGIDQSLLSAYETGRRIPTTDHLMILADFYKTSIDYLMGRTSVREPYPPDPPGK